MRTARSGTSSKANLTAFLLIKMMWENPATSFNAATAWPVSSLTVMAVTGNCIASPPALLMSVHNRSACPAGRVTHTFAPSRSKLCPRFRQQPGQDPARAFIQHFPAQLIAQRHGLFTIS